MFLTNNICLQDTGSRLKRIYSRINTLLNDLTGKNRCRIQMSKCCCRSRVSQVIGRYIYGLYGCNGSFLGRCDPLLKLTHLSCQCRLVSYCGRHTSKQSGNLRSCLYKTEDIINKKKYVSVLLITEILCHSKSGLRNTHTCSGRLVHLSEH